MQYQKFLEKSKKGGFGSYPLNFHSYFEGVLFSNDLQTKFPPANPYYESGSRSLLSWLRRGAVKEESRY